MNCSGQDLVFFDFDNLDPEDERSLRDLLHGQRTVHPKVQFPWDSCPFISNCTHSEVESSLCDDNVDTSDYNQNIDNSEKLGQIQINEKTVYENPELISHPVSELSPKNVTSEISTSLNYITPHVDADISVQNVINLVKSVPEPVYVDPGLISTPNVNKTCLDSSDGSVATANGYYNNYIDRHQNNCHDSKNGDVPHNGTKVYPRRNKKKRPAGYYDQYSNVILKNMETPQNMCYTTLATNMNENYSNNMQASMTGIGLFIQHSIPNAIQNVMPPPMILLGQQNPRINPSSLTNGTPILQTGSMMYAGPPGYPFHIQNMRQLAYPSNTINPVLHTVPLPHTAMCQPQLSVDNNNEQCNHIQEFDLGPNEYHTETISESSPLENVIEEPLEEIIQSTVEVNSGDDYKNVDNVDSNECITGSIEPKTENGITHHSELTNELSVKNSNEVSSEDTEELNKNDFNEFSEKEKSILNESSLEENRTTKNSKISVESNTSEVVGPNVSKTEKQIKSEEIIANKPELSKPKVMNWAGLFKDSSTKSTSQVTTIHSTKALGKSPDSKLNETLSLDNKNKTRSLGEILLKLKLCHRSVPLQPRGLNNPGNWCYINATLQALLSCPPFYHLMKELPTYFPTPQETSSSTPIIDAMVNFVSEFSPLAMKSVIKGAKRVQDLPLGIPFEPTNIYKMLKQIKNLASFKFFAQGRQEDAEEFLSCLLNGLHEEMLTAINLVTQNKDKPLNNYAEANGNIHLNSNDNSEDLDDDEWEQVGPRHRSSITRSAHFAKSPISDIFGGQVRSALHKHGSRESATLQPFFTLQLDIQSDKITSVKEALEAYLSKESLQGYTCAKTKVEVEASRRITLEELPPVLILHLKWLVYDQDGGCRKVLKNVDYSVELEIGKDLLSPNIRNKLHAGQRTYKLFAVEYHYGKEATGGHYITDIFHSGVNGWLRTDDSIVKTILVSQVLKYNKPHVPYLLYYRRCDLI